MASSWSSVEGRQRGWRVDGLEATATGVDGLTPRLESTAGRSRKLGVGALEVERLGLEN